MDVLSDAIGAMRVGRPDMSLAVVDPLWEMTVPAFEGARFYVVTAGRLRVNAHLSDAVAAHHGGSPAPDDRPPLSAVAQRSGYGSAYAFANAFKREYGISAGRYRTASEPVNRGG